MFEAFIIIRSNQYLWTISKRLFKRIISYINVSSKLHVSFSGSTTYLPKSVEKKRDGGVFLLWSRPRVQVIIFYLLSVLGEPKLILLIMAFYYTVRGKMTPSLPKQIVCKLTSWTERLRSLQFPRGCSDVTLQVLSDSYPAPLFWHLLVRVICQDNIRSGAHWQSSIATKISIKWYFVYGTCQYTLDLTNFHFDILWQNHLF